MLRDSRSIHDYQLDSATGAQNDNRASQRFLKQLTPTSLLSESGGRVGTVDTVREHI